MFRQSWQAKLAAQLIQSMREHPEDWERRHDGHRIWNEHLKISIWANRSIRHLDVSWKGKTIIDEDKRSWWVPQWRVNLFKAAKYAQTNADVAKLSVCLSDSLAPAEATSNRMIRIARDILRWQGITVRR